MAQVVEIQAPKRWTSERSLWGKAALICGAASVLNCGVTSALGMLPGLADAFEQLVAVYFALMLAGPVGSVLGIVGILKDRQRGFAISGFVLSALFMLPTIGTLLFVVLMLLGGQE